MTDAERASIEAKVRADAELRNDIANLKTDVRKMQETQAWGIKAIWGAVVYLAVQFWDAVSSGGVIK